jgi:hypothetical protein
MLDSSQQPQWAHYPGIPVILERQEGACQASLIGTSQQALQANPVSTQRQSAHDGKSHLLSKPGLATYSKPYREQESTSPANLFFNYLYPSVLGVSANTGLNNLQLKTIQK